MCACSETRARARTEPSESRPVTPGRTPRCLPGKQNSSLLYPVCRGEPGPRCLGHVLGPNFHAQRNAAHFPVVEFETRALPFTLIEFHAGVSLQEFVADFFRSLENQRLFLIGLENGHNNDLIRREP